MQLLKCENGVVLIHEADTQTYWVIAPICNHAVKLFAGADIDQAITTFKHYSTKGQ